MKFDRTIIITDPCYIATGDDWGSIFDWNTSKIETDIFTDYVWEPTGYGDGTWNIYTSDIPTIESIKTNLQEGKGIGSKVQGSNLLGSFCVDSGNFCIMYLSEVLKYNPDFLETYGSWCYTIVPEFNGDINIFKDIVYGNFHIIGIGNKSFYSL